MLLGRFPCEMSKVNSSVDGSIILGMRQHYPWIMNSHGWGAIVDEKIDSLMLD